MPHVPRDPLVGARLLTLAVLAVTGCSAITRDVETFPEATCQAGATQLCFCRSGDSGVQACLPQGSGWAECECTPAEGEGEGEGAAEGEGEGEGVPGGRGARPRGSR